VREGEDVIGIGLSNDIDPVVIRELNNLNTNDDLKPGQKIKLPVKKN
jgi:LysM repeat protein